MDSGSGVDNSLRSSGLTKWMKPPSQRYDYSDICASPPSDGFFHVKQNAPGNMKRVECFDNLKNKSTPRRGDTSPDLWGETLSNKGGNSIMRPNDFNKLSESNSFCKTSTTSLGTLASAQAAGVMSISGNPSKIYPSEEGPSAPPSLHPGFSGLRNTQSAPVFKDIPSIVASSETGSERLNSNSNAKLIGKASLELLTPDTTPFTTPAVSPSTSPQVTRRGNPFFTGSIQGANTGSWLFRSANFNSTEKQVGNRGHVLYEAKLDLPATQIPTVDARKKVRYVPRPSELRELNFWSPTSM